MKGKQQYLFSSSRDSENTRGHWKITLPIDTLILLGLTIILLVILAFSLGVEKGRKLAYQIPKQEKTVSLAITEIEKTEAKAIALKNNKTTVNAAGIEKKDTVDATSKIPKKDEHYIQVASFAKDAAAKKEVERLKKAGYPTLTLRKGKYIAVYVGGFKTSQEAEKSLKSLRKKYKDCILRRL